MKCPACGNMLTLMVAGDVTVNVCENGCGGIWFDWFELDKLDEPHESVGALLLDVKRREDVQIDETRKRMCPKCDDVVMRQHFFSVKKQVILDECPSCGGVWLDVGELGLIRSQFSSDAERQKAADEYFDEVFGAEFAAMKAENEEKRQKAQRFAHMFRFICPSYYIPGKQRWGAF